MHVAVSLGLLGLGHPPCQSPDEESSEMHQRGTVTTLSEKWGGDTGR